MTLNLWCYFDWQTREPTIHTLINTQQPDVIAFQEAQTNPAFSARPQSDTIGNKCGYSYRVFAPTYRRDGQIDRSGGMTQEASFGLALISKHPIITSETYFLRRHPNHDEACSVLFATVNVDGVPTDLCVVHFGNSDLFAELHLTELMELCSSRDVSPIILGDFNIFNLATYKPTLLADYSLSTDAAQYMSMPKNKGTLDYIAVPKNTFTIDNVTCPDDYVSDHRAVIADITRGV